MAIYSWIGYRKCKNSILPRLPSCTPEEVSPMPFRSMELAFSVIFSWCSATMRVCFGHMQSSDTKKKITRAQWNFSFVPYDLLRSQSH